MRRFVLAAAAVCMSGAVGAQTTTFQSATPVGVFGQADTGAPVKHVVAANTAITESNPLTVSIRQVFSKNPVHARTKASIRMLAGLPAVRIYEAGSVGDQVFPVIYRRASTTGSGGSTPSSGPHSFLLELTDTKDRQFHVQVRFRSTTNGATTTGAARVDIGNDSTFEFDEKFDGKSYLVNFPVTVPASGKLSIQIETEAVLLTGATGPSDYSGYLDVSLEPVPEPVGFVRYYGSSCGPETMLENYSYARQRHFRSILHQAPPTVPAFLVVGVSEISFQFPGTNCFLLTNPYKIFPGTTDSAGRWIIDYPLVPSLADVTIYIQHAIVDSRGWLLTSNGAELKTRPDGGKHFDFFDINHVLSTGQSLAIGWAGGPPLSTTQPFKNKMFDTGMCNAPGTGFLPLVESTVESHHSGFANLVTDHAETEVFQGKPSPKNTHEVLVSCHGRSGWLYRGLQRGSLPYDLGMDQLRGAKSIAAGLNRTHALRAVTVVHGESEHEGGNTTYDADLKQWQIDYERDARQITGQTQSVPMLHSQISSWTSPLLLKNATTSAIPAQQLLASVTHPRRLPLVGPKYMLEYGPDGLHLANKGYRHMGEQYARVYRHVVLEGGTWEPLRPITAKLNGNTVDVRFHVPAPPLVLDTTLVTDPGNKGFEFEVINGTTPSIQRVEVIDEDTVRITLVSAPTSSMSVVRYAFTGTKGSGAGPLTGPRGNLRDSDDSRSRHGNKLYNWCVHFEMQAK